ncbi:hypothetical protein XENORESO_008074, partial [Xenotaenia resolanae]
SSLSDQVHQTPFYIQASPGETAGISCSHSIQSYNRILWYKRSEDRQLQFLGYVYHGTSNPEPGVNMFASRMSSRSLQSAGVLSLNQLR